MVKSFKDFVESDMVDYIIVSIPADALLVKKLEIIQEGAWTPSEINGWSLRLDPERPEIKQQRHVHVARTKHINSKTNQFSWNQDYTRHDRMSFCKSEKGIETARKIAGTALDVPAAKLESVSLAANLIFMTESVSDNNPSLPKHVIYLKIV